MDRSLSVCAIDDDIQNNTEFQGYFFFNKTQIKH